MGRWLRHGWHVALAYVVGFFVLLAVLGWHPDERTSDRRTAKPVAQQDAPVSHREVALRPRASTGSKITQLFGRGASLCPYQTS